jgi:hypothetical protein
VSDGKKCHGCHKLEGLQKNGSFLFFELKCNGKQYSKCIPCRAYNNKISNPNNNPKNNKKVSRESPPKFSIKISPAVTNLPRVVAVGGDFEYHDGSYFI